MVGLILAKSDSSRLKNKNTVDFHGVPMFVVNLRKMLKVFPTVFVSTDSRSIAERAREEGAETIMRSRRLCGDTPNICVYQHAMWDMDDDFVAVQANSPTIDIQLIKTARELLKNYDEVMTCHDDYSIYGSIWAITKDKLKGYDNHYDPKPDILIKDPSVDIHTEEDLQRALKAVV
jgi:CMP-N-acetylneuraminic acid synthetase